MSLRLPVRLRASSSLAPAAVAILALCAGCQSNRNVSQGEYKSPDGAFSMPVPKLGPGLKIEDDTVTDPKSGLRGGFVSFHDDFGHVRAVTYAQLPVDQQAAYSSGARVEDALSRHVREKYLASLQKSSPRATQSHEAPLRLSDGTQAWFTVIQIPEGSPMVVKNSEFPRGRRLDTTRAYVFLYRDGLIFDLSAADDISTGRKLTETHDPTPEELARWKSELSAMHASMRFR